MQEGIQKNNGKMQEFLMLHFNLTIEDKAVENQNDETQKGGVETIQN